MKDLYFKNYNSDNDNDDEYTDYRNIPLNRSEEQIQEQLTQEKYEQIIRNQQRNMNYRSQYQQSNRNYEYMNDTQEDEVFYYEEENTQGQRPRRERPEYEPDEPRKKKKKKKRGCGCGCGTLLICFILIIALAAGGSFHYVHSMCEKTNYIETNSADIINEQYKRDDIYNILLIGADKDAYGTSRSDTMMLVSIDKTHQKIKFTSFMRDMWVDIEGHNSAKLNAAYAYGGTTLLVQTIERNFDIYIDNYVMVDFEMFQKLIDGLGGVTVDITEAEANFINRTSHAKVKKGENTLDGDYALIYCRIRKLDSDFMRTQRQRKVMTAILKQMTTQSLFSTAEAISDVLPLVTTDIDSMKMTFKIFSALGWLKYSNDEMRIPVDGAYSSRYIRGQAALVPDLETNKKELHKFLYEE